MAQVRKSKLCAKPNPHTLPASRKAHTTFLAAFGLRETQGRKLLKQPWIQSPCSVPVMRVIGWVLGELTGGSAAPNYGVPSWSGLSLSTMPATEAQVNYLWPMLIQRVVYFRDVVVWVLAFLRVHRNTDWIGQLCAIRTSSCQSHCCASKKICKHTLDTYCYQTWVVTNSS